MHKKINFRLPTPLFQELEQEALEQLISIADVVRDKILKMRSAKGEQENLLMRVLSLLEGLDQKISYLSARPSLLSNSFPSENPLQLEILYLLREFLFERNGLILRKVDEKLDRVFGKDRRKIV